ncbi:PhzF family phenazine biosynthesis protein [Haloactinospora alba]|uniref:PhzF family phenazine biosynthesis protein n=1 Tax=Haloactinospora alba TaxID=405555 RepID=A0A543NH72_9ACTN|nr:PhzF family phenazine biosynthesis protein [Haloactinospora alba]TQN31198.1 PhzF family phenazine biosynthesis protein [Haloactinospora alba]
MHDTSALRVVTVFLGPGDTGGNLLGVLTEASGLDQRRRQTIAADLGYAETVFLEDAASGALRIHTPEEELPLAGHPLVGTSWLLGDRCPSELNPPAGPVPTWNEGAITWIRADPASAPSYDIRQLPTPDDVDAVADGVSESKLHVWAWEDEEAGQVRARVFPVVGGTREDEATGSAALRLGALLGRPLAVRQGTGSRIDLRPGPDGLVDVGGRCALVETRDHPLS